MKIHFIEKNPNDNVGSYRIWIKDLSKTLADLGHDISMTKRIRGAVPDVDTIIFSKTSYRDIENIKGSLPAGVKIGAINIPCDYRNSKIDFVIVGSHVERVSMSYYGNVFVYPLIERKFMDLPRKIHRNSNKIRLCFHGHYPHLSKFFPHLQSAIEALSKKIETELILITGNANFTWTKKLGMPEGINVEHHAYNDCTFSDILQSCDIGLVPNVSDILAVTPQLKGLTSVDCGLYDTDFFMRYKNKTNSGRSYVFYQHGIPVIHDLSPSNFEFMGKTGRYSCAHDANSWFRELTKFLDPDLRQQEADINKKVFEDHFDPPTHAENLIDFINKI